MKFRWKNLNLNSSDLERKNKTIKEKIGLFLPEPEEFQFSLLFSYIYFKKMGSMARRNRIKLYRFLRRTKRYILFPYRSIAVTTPRVYHVPIYTEGETQCVKRISVELMNGARKNTDEYLDEWNDRFLTDTFSFIFSSSSSFFSL